MSPLGLGFDLARVSLGHVSRRPIWLEPSAVFALDAAIGRAFVDGAVSPYTAARTNSRTDTARELDASGALYVFGSGEPRLLDDGHLFRNAMTRLSSYYSQLFGNWGAASITITDDAVASPFGGMADAIVADGTGTSRVTRGGGVTSGTQVMLAAVVKAAPEFTHQFVLRCENRFSTDPAQWFDLAAGTAGTGTASVDDAGIFDMGDGWFYCWIKATPNATGTTTARVGFGSSDGGYGTATLGQAVYVAYAAIIEGGQPRALVFGTESTTATVGADVEKTVQGYGPELVSDPNDFSAGQINISGGAVVTDDALGDAALVDLSAHADARVTWHGGADSVPDNFEIGQTIRWTFEARAVSGSGTWPVAAFNGAAITGGKLVSLRDEDWTLVTVEAVVTSSTNAAVYLGNRRDVASATLTSAYVRNISVKRVLAFPGFDTVQDGWTVLLELDLDLTAAPNSIMDFYKSNDNNVRFYIDGSGNMTFRHRAAPVSVVGPANLGPAPSGIVRVGANIKPGAWRAKMTGQTAFTSADATPVADAPDFYIGCSATSSALNSYIRSMTVRPLMSGAELDAWVDDIS